MSEEIPKLAKEHGEFDIYHGLFVFTKTDLTAFYNAARAIGFNEAKGAAVAIKPQDINGGISAAAGAYEVWTKHADAIRALEMK